MDLEERAEKAEIAGDFQAALGLWREVAAKEHDAAFFCRYGRVAQRLGKWEEAESAFAEALRLEPNLSEAMESLGDLWITRSDKDRVESLATARDWFVKALTRDRNARALTFLGNAYNELSDLDKARAAFEEAIQIDSNYEEAFYNLALLEEETNPHRSAELLERAIEVDPDYGIAHQALGRVYQQSDDPVRAEYHFRRSLEINPSEYWSMIYVANLLSVQGKIVEADQMYRLAMSVSPDIAAGLDIYARFLESIGKNEEASSIRARMRASD